MLPHISFNEKVININYDTHSKNWTLTTDKSTYKTPGLIMATGYFNLSKPFTPVFKGIESFTGEVIHTQLWKKDYLPKNKNIVVIGNGASAISVIPPLSEAGNKIVMLQRRAGYYDQASEGYFYLFAKYLHKKTGLSFLLTLSRWTTLLFADLYFLFCYLFPNFAKKLKLRSIKKELGQLTPEFIPPYTPWQSRLLYTPNFLRLYKEKAFDIKNDLIDSIDGSTITLKSKDTLEADIIVMATGFNTEFCGGCNISIDHKPFDLTTGRLGTVMISNLPNLFVLSGYFHQSYLFKNEWQSKYIANVLNHMKRNKKSEVRLNMDLFIENTDSEDALKFIKQTYLKRGKESKHNPTLNPILKGPLKPSLALGFLDWFFKRFNPRHYKFK
jgi:cation diffusion facilitator CzcD-associated flavoprotein CzcO